MVKLIFMLKRRSGMSPADFRRHYEQSHVPLTLRHVGHLLKGYRRNYPQSALFNPSGRQVHLRTSDIEYDAIAEMWLENESDLAEMNRIFNDPEINPLFTADEAEFLEREQTLMIVCEELA